MTQSLNALTLFQSFTAGFTHLISGITVLGAGSTLGIHQPGVVTCCLDDLTLFQSLSAGFAYLIAGIAIFRAGGVLGIHQLSVVTCRCHALGSGIGVFPAVKGNRRRVRTNALVLTVGCRGHLAGNNGIRLLHMIGIVGTDKGGGSGKVIVPGPHSIAVSMTGGRNYQITLNNLFRPLLIAKQPAADRALPVGLYALGLAGGRQLRHSSQLVAHRRIGKISQSSIHVCL